MPFFDLLHSDELLNVLRFMSDTPRSESWISGISVTNMRILCRLGGPLQELLLENVTDVSPWTKPQFLVHRSQTEEICHSLGSSITYLSLYMNLHFDIFTCAFVSRLSCLTRLALAPPQQDEPHAEALLQVCGGSLTHLSADVFPFQDKLYTTIATYCTGLEHLSVFVEPENKNSVLRLLGQIGSTVQSLDLRVCDEQLAASDLFLVFIFEQIAILCPHVTDLAISLLNYDKPTAENLYFQCGPRLRTLKVHTCGEKIPLLRALVQSCPSVDMTARVHIGNETGDPTELMQVLGPRLENLEMRGDITLTPQFEAATSQCTNLKEIIISDCTSELPALLRSILQDKKEELTHVNIKFQSAASFDIRQSIADSLGILAMYCGNLRKLSIGAPMLDLNAMRNFAERSLELREFYLHIMAAEQADPDGEDIVMNHVAITVSALESFAKSPKISHICISSGSTEYETEFEDVKNACTLLRYRRVTVSFNDFKYLQ